MPACLLGQKLDQRHFDRSSQLLHVVYRDVALGPFRRADTSAMQSGLFGQYLLGHAQTGSCFPQVAGE